MARWANVIIAGVEIKSPGDRYCRADVLDGEGLKGTIAATNTVALDSSVHTQYTVREKSAVRFGVRVAQMPVAKLDAAVAAIEAAYLAGEEFAVSAEDEDGVDSINVTARADMEALGGKLYTRGGFSSGYVKEVVFRFISTGANEEE